jgi:undecaprenyl-diphosphatase
MIFLPVIILAIIQGVTEFLPISSSGHLVLVHEFIDDEGQFDALAKKRLDVGVHIGTLLAVILYFRNDFIELIKGALLLLKRDNYNPLTRKTINLLIASLPVIIAGLIIFSINPTMFDSITIIAWTTLLFGILLYICDKKPESEEQIENFSKQQALFYGFAQCLALIPGVSRSGITMTAGRYLGHSRTEAAKFSMLMGMVTIGAAGSLTGLSLFQDETLSSDFLIMLCTGMVIAFLTAYISILIMMKWLRQNSFTPFVIYRVLLGLALLALIYSGVIA